MWQSHTLQSSPKLRHHTLSASDRPLTYADFLHSCMNDAAFRDFFLTLLADAPFTAYRWETPPITSATTHRPFEFVLLDCPELDRKPDPASFASHFTTTTEPNAVVAFANLRGDAHLIVPAPVKGLTSYAHLAAFLRSAPTSQKHTLLTTLAATLATRLNDRPLWLSTAGMGVPWLHVRLDSRPKYYSHQPYRDA